MRDGIKLNTVMYSPTGAKEHFPILYRSTPYSVSRLPSPNNLDHTCALAREGYIFVFQDIRGFNKSELIGIRKNMSRIFLKLRNRILL